MRKKNYVVGFAGEGQCVYGIGTGEAHIQPMTYEQAQHEVMTLNEDRRDTRTVFKLVPVPRFFVGKKDAIRRRRKSK